MSWKEENALKRVFNVFKRFKELNGKLWDNDIESLKTLNTAIENNSKAYVNDNKLFAKLLCYIINQNLHSSKDIKTAIKLSHDILKESLGYHLEILTININYNDKIHYFESLGIDINSDENIDKLVNENQKEILEKINKNWLYENIEKSFYNTANDFLKDENNYI